MKKNLLALLCFLLMLQLATGQNKETHFIKTQQKCSQFGNDRAWFLNNIPFFECSDQTIEQVYYYRWLLYKAHIKDLGKDGHIITEFLNPMGWDLKPYNSLNDATGFHIYEGRWLKDQRFVQDYINYMYQQGGNDRHFSEGIADAAYAYYLVNPDKAFITSQLPSMLKIYNAWDDHFDQAKGLYYIEPLLDATEYTISSIDASGGKDGFRGGDAFRPSINSFMYGNALAINKISVLKKDTSTANLYAKKALLLKSNLQKSLWNDSLQHFTDRYKVSNKFVKYWNFIRGRELVGFVPWTYNLPDDNTTYQTAFKHLLDTAELQGKFGMRTNEPSYQYYMRQYRYLPHSDIRECQWNGPSWPFQTSQVLLAMANVLNNYQHQIITKTDYVNMLKMYSLQHFIGKDLNLVEDYDPDKGGPIVNIDQRSEHYNHSEYNDLIITGFCGIRPADNNTLVINPLIADSGSAKNPISYFCIENVLYHGHNLSVLYDKTGRKYHQGIGLSVYVDGKRVSKSATLQKQEIKIPAAVIKPSVKKVNLAVNLTGKGFPQLTASYTDSLDQITMANDGRVWYFKNVKNRWSCNGSKQKTDWLEVNFGEKQLVKEVSLFFYGDEKNLAAPQKYTLVYWDKNQWLPVPIRTNKNPVKPLVNTETNIKFHAVTTDKLRVIFTNAAPDLYTALTEIAVY
ncbi:MAG: glycogen debranching protein [Sphingobacteriaceae bacterium]|nr:MAG: glycogen debranching protein [Sphingobacteriaceae bacterium]